MQETKQPHSVFHNLFLWYVCYLLESTHIHILSYLFESTHETHPDRAGQEREKRPEPRSDFSNYYAWQRANEPTESQGEQPTRISVGSKFIKRPDLLVPKEIRAAHARKIRAHGRRDAMLSSIGLSPMFVDHDDSPTRRPKN